MRQFQNHRQLVQPHAKPSVCSRLCRPKAYVVYAPVAAHQGRHPPALSHSLHDRVWMFLAHSAPPHNTSFERDASPIGFAPLNSALGCALRFGYWPRPEKVAPCSQFLVFRLCFLFGKLVYNGLVKFPHGSFAVKRYPVPACHFRRLRLPAQPNA